MGQRVYEADIRLGEPSMAVVRKSEVIPRMIIPEIPVRSCPSSAHLTQSKSPSLSWASMPFMIWPLVTPLILFHITFLPVTLLQLNRSRGVTVPQSCQAQFYLRGFALTPPPPTPSAQLSFTSIRALLICHFFKKTFPVHHM